MTWNKEKKENAYYLHRRKTYSGYYSEDIRGLFEKRYLQSFSSLNFERNGLSGIYLNGSIQLMWEGFNNGFRACEDL